MTENVPTNPRQFDPRQVGVLTEAKLRSSGESTTPPTRPCRSPSSTRSARPRSASLEHQYDKDAVEQCATFMRQGIVFPPIVLLLDDIIDGNTRIAAAKSAGVKVLPAFKCDFPNPDLAVAFAGAMAKTR